MTLEELIGTTLAVGIPGPDVTDDLVEQLRALHAQTVVVFERNVTSSQQFTQLVQRLDAAVERRLLVMVDHEGGRIIRFHEGITRFPDASTVGGTASPGDIERQGSVEAHELKRLGIQVNLAPCVDVAVETVDPVIRDRSYGSDPGRVAALSVARIRGLQSQGVAACAKHFPGLGAVPKDPHITLPTIALDRDTLEHRHWPPFRAAIEAGVAMVMSSHVCYPALGDPPGLPATFSPRLVRGILRKGMGFSGLILTDDLEMGALRTLGTMGEAAVRATEAGHDLLLFCSSLSSAREAVTSLLDAYRSGRLSRNELEESATRYADLKRRFA